jgi:hypothetical protein
VIDRGRNDAEAQRREKIRPAVSAHRMASPRLLLCFVTKLNKGLQSADAAD